MQGTLQAGGGPKRYVRFGSAKFAAAVLPDDQQSKLLEQVSRAYRTRPLTTCPKSHDPAGSRCIMAPGRCVNGAGQSLVATHVGMLTSLTVRCMQAKAYQQDAVVSILVQSGDNGSESAYGDGALVRLLTFQVPRVALGC